eukprot:3938521-Rhodomonas_salina.2
MIHKLADLATLGSTLSTPPQLGSPGTPECNVRIKHRLSLRLIVDLVERIEHEPSGGCKRELIGPFAPDFEGSDGRRGGSDGPLDADDEERVALPGRAHRALPVSSRQRLRGP